MLDILFAFWDVLWKVVIVLLAWGLIKYILKKIRKSK